ncbi:MAG: hypothetical protein IPI45_08630 [Saprospiraceae bacterium]|nr:hypothetical protein [Saprospiraceae bacterium]MBK7737826.1 hypothetical protein [Saprospiraceae bacterium]MBK7913585.1 hypothetical protein [Saprospiraceae bacterium]
MKPPKVLYYLFVLFLIGFSTTSHSQTSRTKDSLWVIETTDGNTYIGTVSNFNTDPIEINTKIGILKIPKNTIRSITQPEKYQLVHGEYWPENPHSTRHFWGPSSYGLRKGEGYYQNSWIFFNQVSYGFSDHFTLGVGIIPLFIFGGVAETPAWLTPKFNFNYKNGKGAYGVGTIVFGVLGASSEFAGILYGTNTFGNRDKQLTLGLGYGYSSNGGFTSTPTVSLSAIFRTSKKWALLTENYLLAVGDSDSFGFISGGARYMGRKLAIDFGGFIPVTSEIDQLFVLPWLGITVPFKW